MADRRKARRDAIAPIIPINTDPRRITQQRLPSPRGEVRAWFKGGVCFRVRVGGVLYGWGEGPAVWAAVLDGSFRPNDFGNQN